MLENISSMYLILYLNLFYQFFFLTKQKHFPPPNQTFSHLISIISFMTVVLKIKLDQPLITNQIS